MKFTSIVSTAAATFTLALACVLPAQAAGTWETTLLGRDINLNAVSTTDASAVYLYDKTLDITWLRDVNANVTGKVTADANANANGRMVWTTANTWAANLVTGSGAAAISDWRLPTLADPAAACNGLTYSGGACSDNPAASTSEMARLFSARWETNPTTTLAGTVPRPGGV